MVHHFSKPLVTIGIPTYNRAAMLRRAIKSALCQDYYSMIEVIILNKCYYTEHRR
ncbi:glycosyltransferase [bacterium]|nr:glycosyltransferase [bacterium]